MAGVKVVRPADRVADVGSGAMAREAAISNRVTGAEKIWVGYVELPPGMRSSKHHHGEAESAIYIISGQARFITGPEGADVHDAGPGDFVWVPPHEHHVELNRSESEPVKMVVSRSTQETLVFNVD